MSTLSFGVDSQRFCGELLAPDNIGLYETNVPVGHTYSIYFANGNAKIFKNGTEVWNRWFKYYFMINNLTMKATQSKGAVFSYFVAFFVEQCENYQYLVFSIEEKRSISFCINKSKLKYFRNNNLSSVIHLPNV